MPQKQKRALSQLIQFDRYSNWNASKNRREDHGEHVDRQFDMHLAKYLNKGRFMSYHKRKDFARDPDFVERMLEKSRKATKEYKILGSQRAAQFGGVPVLRKNTRIYNCAFSFSDRLRFFQEALWIALCGTGTGFSIMPHQIVKYPSIQAPVTGLAHGDRVFRIPDTIEGWGDALGMLIGSYMLPNQEYVSFDYSLIRPEGAPLSHGMGKAPGPEKLKEVLERIRSKLDGVLQSDFAEYTNSFDLRFKKLRKLRPFDALEISMMSMDAVVAGGTRRTASICVFDPDDHTTRDCKLSPDWFEKKPWLSNSNNSALLVRGGTDEEVFKELIEQSKKSFGDPGIYWANFKDTGPNPCCEIGFYPVSPSNGKTGWGFCNLSTINVAACETQKDLIDAAKMAAVVGTLQAGYTDFGYLGEETEEIARHEALIGVSMTGIMEKPHLVYDKITMMRAANAVVFTNQQMAKALGINKAARATCVKPEGTGSLVLGTSSCGIHPPHAKRYLKRVKMGVSDAAFKHYEKHNPECVEYDLYSKKDGYICFAIEESETAIIRGKDTALQQLDRVKFLKKYWVDKGHCPERCLDPRVENNVSNTISVEEEEWPALTDEMFKSQDLLAGVSFSSPYLDISYHNTPNVAVRDVEVPPDFFIGQAPWPWAKDKSTQKESEKLAYIAAKWEACRKSKPIDFKDINDDSKEGIKITETVACGGGACEVV